jgi:hypothetical protein
LLKLGYAPSPIVPIVIYTGKEQWKEDLVRFDDTSGTRSLPNDLERYVVDVNYILIDEQRYSDDFLLAIGSPAASFFYLDKTDLKKGTEAAERINSILHQWQKRDREIYDLLKRYIIGLMHYKGVEIQEVVDYTEEKGIPMLAQSMDELIELGELQEKQKVLVRQLNKRFGLTEAETALIMAETSREKLDQALDEILFAENKEQVLRLLQG